MELKTRHREQGSEYDGLSTDAFKRGMKLLLPLNLIIFTSELIEREREYNNKKQNKGAAFDSTNNAFKMPKKRELKEAEKKDEELQSIGKNSNLFLFKHYHTFSYFYSWGIQRKVSC